MRENGEALSTGGLTPIHHFWTILIIFPCYPPQNQPRFWLWGSLSTFLHSGLSSIFPLLFFVGGWGGRSLIQGAQNFSGLHQKASTPPLLSSPFFASSASPSLWALQHRPGLENSTLQQRREGERERGRGCRWDGREKGWERWESHQWLYWGHLAGGSGRLWYLHANETQFPYYKITGLNYSTEDICVRWEGGGRIYLPESERGMIVFRMSSPQKRASIITCVEKNAQRCSILTENWGFYSRQHAQVITDWDTKEWGEVLAQFSAYILMFLKKKNEYLLYKTCACQPAVLNQTWIVVICLWRWKGNGLFLIAVNWAWIKQSHSELQWW